MYNRTIKVLNEDSTYKKKKWKKRMTLFDFISPPLFVYLRINLILTYCPDFIILTGGEGLKSLFVNMKL